MHLDVGLVEEAPVAYLTVVHHLLALVPLAARSSSSSSSASASLLTTAAKKALEKGIELKAFRDKCSLFYADETLVTCVTKQLLDSINSTNREERPIQRNHPT